MGEELVPYNPQGTPTPRVANRVGQRVIASTQRAIMRVDAEFVLRARRAENEAHLFKLMVDGTVALAERAMDRLDYLNNIRRSMGADETALGIQLVRLQSNAFRHMERIQMSLYNELP